MAYLCHLSPPPKKKSVTSTERLLMLKCKTKSWRLHFIAYRLTHLWQWHRAPATGKQCAPRRSLARTGAHAGRRSHKYRGNAADGTKSETWRMDGRQAAAAFYIYIYSLRHKQSQIKGLLPPHADAHKHDTCTYNAALKQAESKKKKNGLKWEPTK